MISRDSGQVEPGGASGKEPACQCRRGKRYRVDPWVGKFPWRKAWQPTPVFLRGESHGQRGLAGYIVHAITRSQTQPKHLSTHVHMWVIDPMPVGGFEV